MQLSSHKNKFLMGKSQACSAIIGIYFQKHFVINERSNFCIGQIDWQLMQIMWRNSVKFI